MNTTIDDVIISNIKDSTTSLEDILQTPLVVYSYVTTDNIPGTIIINPAVNSKLKNLFDDNKLFEMIDVKEKQITLKQILEKGIITVGSTDIMETINISYPDQRISNDPPTIKGLYMHGSRKRLIAEYLNTEFMYDPASEHEYDDFDDETNNNDSIGVKHNLDWLCSNVS